MNIPNNKKRKKSQDLIEKTFIQLIQTKEINEITVSDICKLTNLNRSTFYANYLDIYDLADKLKDKMFLDIIDLYTKNTGIREHTYDYLTMFKHIKENQIYYKTLFKLNFDLSTYFNFEDSKDEALRFYSSTDYLDYHIEYFKAGLSAIIKKWLFNGCKESPEVMNEILKSEYKKKNTLD